MLASPFMSLISVSPRVTTLPPTSVGGGCFAVETGSLAMGRPTAHLDPDTKSSFGCQTPAPWAMRYRAQLPT